MNRRGFLKSLAAVAGGVAVVPLPKSAAEPVADATIVFKAGQQPQVSYPKIVTCRAGYPQPYGTFTARHITAKLNLSEGLQELLDSGECI